MSKEDLKWLETVTEEDLDDPNVLTRVVSLVLELRERVTYKGLLAKLMEMICQKYSDLCIGDQLNLDNISIEELDLPENIQRALARSWIYTIGDLRKAIKEAQAEGEKKGKDWEPILEKRIKGVSNTVDQILEALRKGGVTVEGAVKGSPRGRLKSYLPRSERLDKLYVSANGIIGLNQNGIKTVQELMDFITRCIHNGLDWQIELVKLPGVGQKTVYEIDEDLQRRKLLNEKSRPVGMKPVPALPGETPITRDFVNNKIIYNILYGNFSTIEQVQRQLKNDPEYFLERPQVGKVRIDEIRRIFER